MGCKEWEKDDADGKTPSGMTEKVYWQDDGGQEKRSGEESKTKQSDKKKKGSNRFYNLLTASYIQRQTKTEDKELYGI